MRLLLMVVAYLLLGSCQPVLQKSEIEIMTTPAATVYIDDRQVGNTENSFKMTDLKPGKARVRLVPQDSQMKEWSGELDLNNLTTTVVDRYFSNEEKYAWGYVMYPEKIGGDQDPAVIINSNPGDASVKLDGQIIGRTPTKIEKIVEGDRHLVISYPGFESQNLFIKAKKGYQIVIDIELPETKIDIPTRKETESQETTSLVEKVLIKETGTGWLRVRSSPSTAGEEVGKVDVGSQYELLENNETGWYKIEVDDSISGWISAEYAEKVAGLGQ